MEIDPAILVPAAAFAVLVMILYIRLIAGRREASIDEAGIRAFLALQVPELSPDQILISEDGKAALIIWEETDKTNLVRCFGDKLVMQPLATTVISKSDLDPAFEGLQIPRQGLTLPPLLFRALSAEPPDASDEIEKAVFP